MVAAPSGAGKTTLVHRLMEALPHKLAFSVSATTRAQRGHEQHGVDYYFLTVEEFQQRIDAHAFVEYEEVYPGRYYGTLKSELHRINDLGRSTVFDVDVKGALSLKRKFGANSLAVFIQPPSAAVLQQRLEGRGTESPDEIARRMARAEFELAQAPHFDVVILNDDLTTATQQLITAVELFLNGD
jgi:guanylate kinase